MADQPPLRPARNARPVARTGVAGVEIDGETVLLDRGGHVHLLNATAGLLWTRFDGSSTLEHVAADVADAFGLPVATVLADASALVAELTGLGLLTDAGDQSVPS